MGIPIAIYAICLFVWATPGSGHDNKPVLPPAIHTLGTVEYAAETLEMLKTNLVDLGDHMKSDLDRKKPLFRQHNVLLEQIAKSRATASESATTLVSFNQVWRASSDRILQLERHYQAELTRVRHWGPIPIPTRVAAILKPQFLDDIAAVETGIVCYMNNEANQTLSHLSHNVKASMSAMSQARDSAGQLVDTLKSIFDKKIHHHWYSIRSDTIYNGLPPHEQRWYGLVRMQFQASREDFQSIHERLSDFYIGLEKQQEETLAVGLDWGCEGRRGNGKPKDLATVTIAAIADRIFFWHVEVQGGGQ